MNIKNKLRYILPVLLLGIFIIASTSDAATKLFPYQGGTGLSSAVSGDVNKFLQVSDDSPFTYTLTTVVDLITSIHHCHL